MTLILGCGQHFFLLTILIELIKQVKINSISMSNLVIIKKKGFFSCEYAYNKHWILLFVPLKKHWILQWLISHGRSRGGSHLWPMILINDTNENFIISSNLSLHPRFTAFKELNGYGYVISIIFNRRCIYCIHLAIRC